MHGTTPERRSKVQVYVTIQKRSTPKQILRLCIIQSQRSAPKQSLAQSLRDQRRKQMCVYLWRNPIPVRSAQNKTSLIVGAIPERSAPKNNGSHLRHNTREISTENKASFIYGTIPQRSFMPQSQRDQRWKHIYVYLWLNPRRSQADMAPLDNSVWQNSSRVK